jgi:hypothetical protein
MNTLRIAFNAFFLTTAMSTFLAPQHSAAATPAYVAPLAQLPMDQIVRRRLVPQLEHLFEQLEAAPTDAEFQGVRVYASGDRFLPGKIIVGIAHLVLNTPSGDPRLERYLAGSRTIVRHVAGLPNDTWGIYYALMAINRLDKAGLLARAIDEESLARLKKSLDWRRFVTPSDYRLIDLPTNYYGVAFGVARLRMLLGWESSKASEALLAQTLEHYEKYSGAYGFSDETEGEGRFDRYSVLLIAEICQRFIETGLEVTPELKAMLRKSAEVVLKLANVSGDGFGYGRSIGPYGDTAALEVLAAAAYLEVLSAEEAAYAYAYATRIAAKYVDFWVDRGMGSVNLWRHGRRTDKYRGEHRILGENFSLIHQLITTNELWNRAGLRNQTPRADLGAWLELTQPRFDLIWFARGRYDRALVLVRDRDRVFSLPLINGGTGQHQHAPYYPLPFSPRLLEGQPDSGHRFPLLMPKFVLDDGSELLATSFAKDIELQTESTKATLSYRQDELDRLEGAAPVPDERIAASTRYDFGPGFIARTDTYRPASPLALRGISLDFATFSKGAVVKGSRVTFASGAIEAFDVEGFETCVLQDIAASALRESTSGPMQTHVRCERGPMRLDEPLVLRWKFSYR